MGKLSETILKSGRLSRRYKIVNKYLNLCKLIYKACCAFGIVCCLVICAYPGAMYFFTKKLVFAFSCYIPFIDPFTSSGYTITMIFHLLCLVMIIQVTLGLDTLFMFGVVQCVVLVDIFQVQIDEFNEILQSNDSKPEDPEFQARVGKSLKAIFQAHQAIGSAMSRVGTIFFWPIAVQVGLSVMSMAISLFMAVTVMYLTFVFGLALP
jgi:odorant receptor